MATPDPRLVCQVIPDGLEWACTRRGSVEGEGEPILCKRHRKQYRKLTSKYQDRQRKAETAYGEVLGLLDSTEPERLKPLLTLDSVKKALEVTDLCFRELREEISGREALQKRFFREVDDNHRMRIKFLQDEQTRVNAVVKMLEARKRELAETAVVRRNHWHWRYRRNGHPDQDVGQDITCMKAFRRLI